MKIKSLWLENNQIKKTTKLNKNLTLDVLIIGGGMTGLNTALELRKSNLNIAIVEQNKVGNGVSSRTTGKINYLQETIYQDLENNYSYDIAKKYLDSQKLAIKKIKSNVYKYKIKCDLDRTKSYVFTSEKKEVKKIQSERNILKSMGVKVNEHYKIDGKFNCKYAISVNDTYVFNCVKYMNQLKEILIANKIKIYENTRVKKMKKVADGYICFTENYKIKAKKVVIACHYPFFLKPYFMPLKVSTEKSYIIAAKVKDYKKINYITSTIPCKSVRYYKDKNNYLIYASNSHNICNDLNNKKNVNKVLKEAKKLNLKVCNLWTNDDLMTVDKLPYIGPIEKNNNSLLIGTGYNTWGMTNSILAGIILSDLIQEKENKYLELFNPLRVNICSDVDKYLNNIGSNSKSFIENKIVKNKLWYNDSVFFENKNDKNIATYIDESGKRHTVLSTCPHMKCTLIFNEVEHTWDCPCHASRFDLDGKCIKGPSTYDISYKEDE